MGGSLVVLIEIQKLGTFRSLSYAHPLLNLVCCGAVQAARIEYSEKYQDDSFEYR